MKKTGDKLPRLIVLSAPSGGGKTTLCQMLLNEFPNIHLSISATTRKIRPQEKEGVHYQFLTEAAFKAMRDKGEFAEWAQVHNNLYGTLKKTVETALAQGKNVLFDIDVQGAMSLKKLYPRHALLVFVHPPSMEELEKRLRARKGDTPDAIETRLQNAYDELEWSKRFDHQITNDNLERAYQELREIILKECP